MPKVHFTPHLRRHLSCESVEVAGRTVADALGEVFNRFPAMRSYILDDQGAVRQHVMIFVDDSPLRDRSRLTDELAATSEVFVMQALSGG